MGAIHGHNPDPTGRRLKRAVLLTTGVLVLELGGGLWAGSLALLADAGHVAADIFALALSWFAIAQSRRPADQRRTYGYHRAGILAALANAGILLVVTALLVYEAVHRLFNPARIEARVVVAAALVAVAVNLYVALSLHRDRADLNIRAALLHVVGDLAAGVGVVVAGLAILATGWTYADPIASLAIAGLVAWSGLTIAREAVNVLLEGAPKGLDLDAVEEVLRHGAGVTSVHDLHVWTVSLEHAALSAHLVVGELTVAEGEHLVRELESDLCARFGIGHTTIQLESCHPCAEDAGHGRTDHNHPHPVAGVV